jgi:cytochrome c oxidase assembly protein subunit 15
MVSSGLTERVSVSQYRLAFHLTFACAIFAFILWSAQGLAPRGPVEAPARMRTGAAILLGLVLLQIYLGALVAGLRAGLVYNTWPLIDGSFIPDPARLLFEQPAWRNLFENTLTVQFDHRMAAYALWFVALLHAIDARHVREARAGAFALAAAVTVQAALGIVTLLNQAPLALALAHQAMAAVVLTLAVVHAQKLMPKPARLPRVAAAAVQPG